MADLNVLAESTTKAIALNNVILVTPQKDIGFQPQNPASNTEAPGETGAQSDSILFHIKLEEKVTLTSEVTDHVVEDNTTIQDQIGLKPETINTGGLIGELNNEVPKELAALNKVAQKLYIVSAFTPALSVTALQAYNAAKLIYDVAKQTRKAAVAGWSSINGGNNSGEQGQTKQQKFFTLFYGYWKKRTLFKVQTPFAIFENCAIMNLTAVQGAETDTTSEFELTFKPLKFAETKTLTSAEYQLIYQNAEGRTFNQLYPEVNVGPNSPVLAQDVSEVLPV